MSQLRGGSQIVDAASEQDCSAPTKVLIHGLVAGNCGDLEQALLDFRNGLKIALRRDERIRALQFLVLTTSELKQYEASLGYADELLAFDPDNYMPHLWRSDILRLLGRHDEAEKEHEEAHRLLESLEDDARKGAAHVDVDDLRTSMEKGDLRSWITESTSPVLAPLRALLVANPGQSNHWEYLVDQVQQQWARRCARRRVLACVLTHPRAQLFQLDVIFGPSQFVLDAQLLEEAIGTAVSEKRLEVRRTRTHAARCLQTHTHAGLDCFATGHFASVWASWCVADPSLRCGKGHGQHRVAGAGEAA